MDKQALEIMEWLAQMGDDVPLCDEPVDRFVESEKIRLEMLAKKKTGPSAGLREDQATSPQPVMPGSTLQERVDALKLKSRQSTQPQGQSEATIPDESVVQSAREAAQAAATLDELRNAIEAFQGCNLRRTAKHTVFADGNPEAKIMLVGEAPGRDEDLQGLPFVGQSGQLLDRMLATISLDRSSTYISNVIPWRPPGNRTPTPAEVEICRPFIERHMELVSPEIVVMVGGSSAKMMLQTNNGILKLRGKWRKFKIGGREVDTIATLHPAYLLRQPAQKRLAWHDLLMIREKLSELGIL
jgi:DNA polymerase